VNLRLLRLALVVLVILFTIATLAVGIAISSGEPISIILIMGLWAILGALIVLLRPANAVGWLFILVGLLWTVGYTASASAERSGPALALASWFSEWFWLLGFGLIIVSLYLIPTGRVPSRAWRPVVGLYAGALVVLVSIAALEDELQASDTAPIVENPIGIEGLRDLEAFFGGGAALVMFAGAIGGAASLVFRYRNGSADERQQLKLVAVAVPLAVACAFLGGVTDETSLSEVFWGIAVASIPVSVSVAILRYRLFDVDLLISRTLVYGLVTVLLGAAYVGLVLAGQAVFSSFAGGGDLAIAVSTLVVAALFLPLRSRVQRFVDRRFYRRRYDAQRTLEAFGARLRQEVEVDVLSADLRGVVDRTMQPAHVSIWLREKASA
jgi:hypothetical protein